jgi:hypothetical protein
MLFLSNFRSVSKKETVHFTQLNLVNLDGITQHQQINIWLRLQTSNFFSLVTYYGHI